MEEEQEEPRRLLTVTVYKPIVGLTGENDLFVVASILNSEGNGENFVYEFCYDKHEAELRENNPKAWRKYTEKNNHKDHNFGESYFQMHFSYADYN